MQPNIDTDFLQLDDLLTDDEKAIRSKARDFVTAHILPDISDYFEKGEFPAHLIPMMGELGFLGPSLSGYGCPGHSETAYGLIMQEIERVDSGIRSFATIQSSLVMYPILAFGTEEQKERWLPQLSAGQTIGCFALTEPNHGSDPAGMETTVRQDGDSYILNGVKRWATNSTIADVAVVWAKDEQGYVGCYFWRKTHPALPPLKPGAKSPCGRSSPVSCILRTVGFRRPINCRGPEVCGRP